MPHSPHDGGNDGLPTLFWCRLGHVSTIGSHQAAAGNKAFRAWKH
ncbi:hypothetical protein SXCC_03862 [Gluconacetobacter sp. SXCC-1]|nr:hypothetical protein SXCC_03862 [Gluconacetobacter sp. SXCC-1]